jgi:hypothetical protein
MNIQLDPPPVSPLSPSQRARLRNRVMDQSAPVGRPSRRWAAPAIAVAAVSAVVAGTLVISNQISAPVPGSPPVAGGASSRPGTAADAAPGAVKLDRGPVSRSVAEAEAKLCRFTGAKQSQIVWSRRVASPGSAVGKEGVVVLMNNTPGQPGGFYNLGLMACFPVGAGSAIRDSAWNKQPTPAQGLIVLSASGIVRSDRNQQASMQFQTLYRVRPEIVRLQARYVWDKGAGPWFEGVVTNGFAFTATSAMIPHSKEPAGGSDPNHGHEELRAFDSLGNPVPLTY